MTKHLIEWVPQLSMWRRCSISALTRWLPPFLEPAAYRTFDLSGDELVQPSIISGRCIAWQRIRACASRRMWGVGHADDVWRAIEVMLGRVDRLETHPIRKLYDAGIRVTVNTDDALVFGPRAFLD
jgi:hypothetical protein